MAHSVVSVWSLACTLAFSAAGWGGNVMDTISVLLALSWLPLVVTNTPAPSPLCGITLGHALCCHKSALAGPSPAAHSSDLLPSLDCFPFPCHPPSPLGLIFEHLSQGLLQREASLRHACSGITNPFWPQFPQDSIASSFCPLKNKIFNNKKIFPASTLAVSMIGLSTLGHPLLSCWTRECRRH